MRATFCEICLFNDASQEHDTSFILNGKEWGVGQTEREIERGWGWKKSERQSVGEKGLRHGS
jgi:hypothetical protein